MAAHSVEGILVMLSITLTGVGTLPDELCNERRRRKNRPTRLLIDAFSEQMGRMSLFATRYSAL
jgi:hypothetical protein